MPFFCRKCGMDHVHKSYYEYDPEKDITIEHFYPCGCGYNPEDEFGPRIFNGKPPMEIL